MGFDERSRERERGQENASVDNEDDVAGNQPQLVEAAQADLATNNPC